MHFARSLVILAALTAAATAEPCRIGTNIPAGTRTPRRRSLPGRRAWCATKLSSSRARGTAASRACGRGSSSCRSSESDV